MTVYSFEELIFFWREGWVGLQEGMSFTITESCVGFNSVGRTLGSFLLRRLCYGLNRNIWHHLRSNPTAATMFQVRFASREHTIQVKTDLLKLAQRSKHTNQTPNTRTFLWYLETNLTIWVRDSDPLSLSGFQTPATNFAPLRQPKFPFHSPSNSTPCIVTHLHLK